MMRRVLSQRRAAETFDLRFWNQPFTVTVGLYADGTPGEVFIDGGKTGQDIQNTARDAAVVLSLALQHGIPIETIRHAITRDGSGAAASILGAIVDALPITNSFPPARKRLMGVDPDEFSDRDPIAFDAVQAAKDAPADDPFNPRCRNASDIPITESGSRSSFADPDEANGVNRAGAPDEFPEGAVDAEPDAEADANHPAGASARDIDRHTFATTFFPDKRAMAKFSENRTLPRRSAARPPPARWRCRGSNSRALATSGAKIIAYAPTII